MRNPLLLTLVGLLALPSLSSCNDTDSDGSIRNICEAQCSRQQRCASDGGTVESGCVQDCLSDAPADGVFLSSALGTMRDCLQTLACGTSDDQCMLRAVTEVNPNWQQDAVFQACMTKHASCDQAGGVTFSDDNCGNVLLLTQAARASFSACMQKTCDQVPSCLEAVFQGR